ncbi:MAG: hypothetical protein HGA36_01150 [Candidatus Moranbacteria bacterium]|nr:hypothetical protein [Candidatus Moranbacteria bacterium]
MNIINTAHAGVITDAPSVSHIGMNVLNFLLSVTEIIAILALVIAGILYLASAGDEKRLRLAKTAATYAVLGIVFAIGGMILIKLIGQFFQG